MSSKTKIIISLLLLLAIVALLTPRTFDFVTSIVPGWHTFTFPALSYSILLWGWFVIVMVGYFTFLRNRISRKNGTIYLTLTLTSLMIMTFIMNGSLFLVRERQFVMMLPMLLVCFLLFITVQVWFVCLAVKIGISSFNANGNTDKSL